MSPDCRPDKAVEGCGLSNDGRLLLFESLPSTNSWAMANLDCCRHGDVVCAAHQAAGRGRFDRAWLACADRGLTLSIVLDESDDSPVLSCIGQCGAIAVARCLEDQDIAALVKWPNDVLVGERKIAGMLAERDSETGRVVLGIGLNINMSETDFGQAHLGGVATSMLIEAGREFEVAAVRRRLLLEVDAVLSEVRVDGSASIVSAWRRRDSLEGSEVELHGSTQTFSGKYAGMDNEGRIRIVNQAGELLQFWSGDVKRLRESKKTNEY
jgi:BirA family biotin operon repressor/biotin-[acetyl-CoA-carboxylase] ligase